MSSIDPSVRDVGTEGPAAFDAAALDGIVAALTTGESTWAATPTSRRVELLSQVHAGVAAQAQRWVDAAAVAKALPLSSRLVGEEWISGPYVVLTSLLALRRSLATVQRGANPVEAARFGTAPGGRLTVPLLPLNAYEALLLHGFSAEAWFEPGTTRAQVTAEAGLGALHPDRTDGVGLVLGAGNITSIAVLDVLYELFVHNRTAMLKLNPTMDGLQSVYRDALRPLIDLGVLRIETGGAEVGAYLVQHPGISHVHITGSAITHDTIVWGRGPDAARRRRAGTPLLDKPITSELGGVSPIIVLPGAWSKADLRFQAEHVATQRLHNGAYNCIAGQVVLISSDWSQREAFLDQLKIALAAAPARAPWYPGSDARLESAAATYPGGTRIGAGGMRLLIEIAAEEDARTIETIEYFSPVLGVITVPGTGQPFLDAAVETANRELTGTLGANIIASPRTIKQLGATFRDAVARLRHGTVAINAWTGVGFLTATAPWGAFPGHTLDDVQSGIGVVHNALLLPRTERTVLTGPFRPFPRSFLHGEFSMFPKPPWFVSARSARATGRRLTLFAARPGWARVPAVFAAAFRA